MDEVEREASQWKDWLPADRMDSLPMERLVASAVEESSAHDRMWLPAEE